MALLVCGFFEAVSMSKKCVPPKVPIMPDTLDIGIWVE